MNFEVAGFIAKIACCI